MVGSGDDAGDEANEVSVLFILPIGFATGAFPEPLDESFGGGFDVVPMVPTGFPRESFLELKDDRCLPIGPDSSVDIIFPPLSLVIIFPAPFEDIIFPAGNNDPFCPLPSLDIIFPAGPDCIFLPGLDAILPFGPVVEAPITGLTGADDIFVLGADDILPLGAVVEVPRTGVGVGTPTVGLVGADDGTPTDDVVGAADGTPTTGPVDGTTFGAFVDNGKNEFLMGIGVGSGGRLPSPDSGKEMAPARRAGSSIGDLEARGCRDLRLKTFRICCVGAGVARRTG